MYNYNGGSMKRIKKILLFLIIVFIGIVIMLFVKNNKKEDKIVYKKEITINVGENIPSINKYINKKDIDKIKNKKITWKDITIEDNKTYYTGTYKGIFKYKNENYSVKLIVKDNEKPIINNVKDITIYIDDKIDFFKNIEIKDNSKDEISKDIEGDYDISKKGEYNLKYIVRDKSNNIAEKEFKLVVKEKEKTKTINNNETKVIGKSSKGYTIELRNGIYYVKGILIANKTYNLPSNYNPGGLLNEFTTNFNKLKEDASNEGINLKIISAFRSYNTQVTLYNNYVKRDGKAAADRYSARAGHSEHQTGLAADINSLEQSWKNTKEGKWLNDNCYKYGFIIRYPEGKESITGYMFEPWHIRYVGKDIATKLYNNGNWITLEEYLGIDSKYN